MRQRAGYQGTVPDDLIVGIEQARPMTETPAPQISRARTSSVGEAHRRALERRQLAQQAGDPVPPRRLSGVARAADQPGGTRTTPEIPDRRATVIGEEGVSQPRIPELPSSESVAAPPHQALTAPLPSAAPPAPARQRVEERPPWSPPPGMQTPPVAIADRPPAAAWPPAPDTRAERPSPPPPAMPSPNEPPRNAIEADWYAAERHHHRGKRCANCRDFQVAESGDRGWCRNRFAFPTPQLVGPNDLACLSCIGTWWAANDQWWLARAPIPPDVPTPMADEILEELRERDRRQAALRRPGAG